MKLKYSNTDICPHIGDIVKFIEDDSNMVVENVIDTQEKRKKCGLEENGIMMRGEKYGLIFNQLKKNSEIVFIQRKKEKS